jgi:hypothetical protein
VTNQNNSFWDDEVPTGYPAKYSEEYRHFDVLIWQTPIISSAILAFTLSTLSDDGNVEPVSAMLLLLIVSFILGTIYYNLFRWRVHQQYTERSNAPGLPDRRTKKHKRFGAQFYLQLSTGLLFALAIGLSVHFLFFKVLQLNTIFLENKFWILLGVIFILTTGLVIITWMVEKKIAQHLRNSKKLKTKNLAVQMINGSIDAYIKRDFSLARKICETNELPEELTGELIKKSYIRKLKIVSKQ